MSSMNPDQPTHQTAGTLVQARVLFALLMREMTTRFGRSAAGYLWALIEPVGFIALLSLAFSQIAHSPPIGRSFPLFYATGYIAFSFYNDIAALTGRAVLVNRPLLNYPAVTALDTVLARFLLQSLTGLAVAAVVFSGILAVFADQVRLQPVPLITAFALAGLLGLGGCSSLACSASSPRSSSSSGSSSTSWPCFPCICSSASGERAACSPPSPAARNTAR